MLITFMGGKQPGVIGLLSVLACGHQIEYCVAYDFIIYNLAESLRIPILDSIKDLKNKPVNSDLLISVHGREIVPDDVLARFPLGGLNAHPGFKKYKGKDPIARALKSREKTIDIGFHKMTNKVDEGYLYAEQVVDISDLSTELEVRNRLYPHYAYGLIHALEVVDAAVR